MSSAVGTIAKSCFFRGGAGESFERCLYEVVNRCGWKLHAYVIVSNHYHLAVETPEPNLVFGMKWLQSTFATRFNRLRNERGHVFQGRYKAILIGEDRPLLGLVDYVHLNPVRAGIRPLSELKDYGLSSYPKYFERKVRNGLCREDFLSILGEPNSLAGIRRYAKHLEWSEEGDPKRRDVLTKRYCCGWFIAAKEEKKALEEDLRERHPDVVLEGSELKALNEVMWEGLVVKALAAASKSEADTQSELKGAPWKAGIARTLRAQTTAGNLWIAKRLNMGHPSRVTNLIRELSMNE